MNGTTVMYLLHKLSIYYSEIDIPSISFICIIYVDNS